MRLFEPLEVYPDKRSKREWTERERKDLESS